VLAGVEKAVCERRKETPANLVGPKTSIKKKKENYAQTKPFREEGGAKGKRRGQGKKLQGGLG